jgi:hypothetical protein
MVTPLVISFLSIPLLIKANRELAHLNLTGLSFFWGRVVIDRIEIAIHILMSNLT